MKAAAVLLVDQWAMSRRFAFADEPAGGPAKDERKVIVVACGGIRRAETFLNTGLGNIPHLCRDLMPRSVFYPYNSQCGRNVALQHDFEHHYGQLATAGRLGNDGAGEPDTV